MSGLYNYPGFLGDIIRGDTLDFMITMKDSAGDPLDISGSKFYLTFDTALDPDGTPFLQITIDPTDPTEGKTTGEVTDDQTFSMQPGTWFYSIRFINALGAAYVLDIGRIKVRDGVSGKRVLN